MNKDIKRLMGRLLEQGFTYQLRKSGRLLVYRGDELVASIPTTAKGAKMSTYVGHLTKVGFNA